MIFPEVKKLYKYMAFNANTMSCLVNGEFWCAKPQTFNDPLDCGLLLFSSMTTEAFVAILEKISQIAQKKGDQAISDKFQSIILDAKAGNLAPSELVDKIEELLINSFSNKIQEIGILSFSEVNDNILMWSHYAEQHKGICVEFLRESSNDLADNDKTLPVRYSIKKPLISVGEQILASTALKKEIRRSLIYTKSSDWSYEREWRLVTEKGNIARKINAAISSITFGLKMKLEQRKTIINIFKNNSSIKFKEVVLKEDDFGVSIVDFDISPLIDRTPNKKVAPKKSTTARAVTLKSPIVRRKANKTSLQ